MPITAARALTIDPLEQCRRKSAMPKRWLGIVVSSNGVTAVDAEVPPTGPITIQADHSWRLQTGDRGEAYAVMHRQIKEYVSDSKIDRVVVKESAVSLAGTTKAHLHSAELRGVVLCASAAVTNTKVISKANISRNFGNRKVDEYLGDDGFWAKKTTGKLRSGSREAAMMLLAARKAE
jgi:hypothetical protein